MDILNFPIPTFCNPKTLNPSSHTIATYPFRRNPFSLYISSSSSRNFRTLAQFGRPTNRRNSLRKKLLQDQQVSTNHIPTDPSSVNGVEESDTGFQGVSVVDNVVEVEKPKSKVLGESVLLSKLENWVEQFKEDNGYWGIGSGPIFTVYQDSSGAVKSVSIDEDEILLRCRVGRGVIEDSPEVGSKIMEAKNLAREMETGNNVIARNSSVAKFVVQGEEEGGFVKAIRGFVVQPRLLPKLSGNGGKVLCVLVVLWAVKKLFAFGDKEARHTEMEKEMMRRKIKARKERGVLAKGVVEVIPEPSETPVVNIKKPTLDKEQLKNNILKAKASTDKLLVQDSSAEVRTGSMDMDNKVQEIREMARQAREIEGRDRSLVSRDMEMNDPVIEKPSHEIEVIRKDNKQDNSLSDHQNKVARETTDNNAILMTGAVDVTEKIDNPILHEVVPFDESNLYASDGDREINKHVVKTTENAVHLKDREDSKSSNTHINGSSVTDGSSTDKKPRIIRSVKEARDYLSKRHDKLDPDTGPKIEPVKENIADLKSSSVIDFNDQRYQNLEMNTIVSKSETFKEISDFKPAINGSEGSNHKDMELSPTKNDCLKDSGIEPGLDDLQKSETTLDDKVDGPGMEKNIPEVEPVIKQIRSDAFNGISDSKPSINPSEDSNQKDVEFGSTKDDYFEDSGVELGVGDLQKSESSLDHEVNGVNTANRLSGKTENWLEENFHEVEPIIKQIRAGFRDNYMEARERVDQPLDIPTEMESLGVVEDGGELDWMQDDHLRDIVFRVRENELSGRDPFYSMSAGDKEAFFRGLEKNVEKENRKLSHLHEWLHSNIENLDYGADGISIYDPPEKIIPRWKGPPVEQIPQVLNEFLDKRKANSTRNMKPVMKDENSSAKKSADSSLQGKKNDSIAPITKLKNPKTVIEGSDGSVKVGKKSGKEYWQHTKKWSQGFLDSYNAETDPEIKSTMKDIGKDLDRWITEKEIEEAAELMDKLPDRNKSFVEKKLNKLKREMELYGPQAVVSKYREYADDKEEDYLWWLDLPYVLCIEMYTIDDGEQRVGFYSLEMAEDLELEPKPYHVIAFQDPGDCKSLCYIIQAHMDMLGNGNAFVVAQPPKDAFRDAKANGFGVTVIKKGELQLNIDQPLEEVEEQIKEIGSKVYHDTITKERSVDINSLMKGVFGLNDRTTKRLKRKLKKPRKG
ncbi:uncharacterized protein LOC130746270 [Lotus japonicus]|uniref:uncharacterized protein LOC130746270 n=1 Tax=Lotus japonicus TaxID=34305 RepID=UPI00258E8421|nr:uncharacterized protein LOC130746270 [Lotus japonicus]